MLDCFWRLDLDLRLTYANLKEEGMLMMDCYGGPEAQVPQEEEREQDGFDYDPVNNQIDFYGEACEKLRNGEIVRVK